VVLLMCCLGCTHATCAEHYCTAQVVCPLGRVLLPVLRRLTWLGLRKTSLNCTTCGWRSVLWFKISLST
jgi:hypothetical protein